MSTPFHSPEGEPLTVEEFAERVDGWQKFIADDYTERGRVVTIFDGMDVDLWVRRMKDENAQPCPYETAIFRGATPEKQTTDDFLICGRWETRERALDEHAKALERFKRFPEEDDA